MTLLTKYFISSKGPHVRLIKYLLINNVFNRFSIQSIVTGCHAHWTSINDVQPISPNWKKLYHHAGSLELCKHYCEKSVNCSSVEWEYSIFSIYFGGCYQYLYPYNISSFKELQDSSYHVVNRSTKNIERCIGNYEGKRTDVLHYSDYF